MTAGSIDNPEMPALVPCPSCGDLYKKWGDEGVDESTCPMCRGKYTPGSMELTRADLRHAELSAQRLADAGPEPECHCAERGQPVFDDLGVHHLDDCKWLRWFWATDGCQDGHPDTGGTGVCPKCGVRLYALGPLSEEEGEYTLRRLAQRNAIRSAEWNAKSTHSPKAGQS